MVEDNVTRDGDGIGETYDESNLVGTAGELHRPPRADRSMLTYRLTLDRKPLVEVIDKCVLNAFALYPLFWGAESPSGLACALEAQEQARLRLVGEKFIICR
jgi:hypothetical protein